jgi:excisionase family DNA binding protein
MNNTAKFNGSAMQLISITQLGDILGVSRATIYRWIKDGLIPSPIQLGPRRVAFPRESVEQFISSRADVREVDASAHLIAAAPDLLAALECLLDKADYEWSGEWPETRNDARAAIAKAKGETV